jgi:membrane protein DedA with SNARE-associated domain
LHALTTFFLNLVDHAGYAGLFIAMTLANVGAPVGSEIVLPAAGALAATGHLSSVWLAIALAVAAELVGQSIGYAIGRFGGRPFIDRYGRYVRFHHAELERVENFFGRYGKFAIFICRFIPVVRGIVGIPAGIAEMPLGAFYLWTFLGSLIFCGGLILAGHALGAHADEVIAGVRKYALLILGVGIVALVAFLFIQSRRTQRNPS